MNYPGTGQSPPTLSPPPKKGVPAALIVLGIFALALLAVRAKAAPVALIVLSVIVLLAALAVAGGVRAVRAALKKSERAVPVGNSFVDFMGQHEYEKALALMTPQVRTEMMVQAMEEGQTLMEKHHGAFLDHGKPETNVQRINGQSSVQLTYPAQFSGSEGVILLVMVDEGAGYQVQGFQFAL